MSEPAVSHVDIYDTTLRDGSQREGLSLSFWDYLKVGVPLTIVTTLAGLGLLHLRGYA